VLTSAFSTEQVVQAALDSLMSGRTVLVVAHRLSTIRNADRIVVFKKGVVMEEGRHDDLIAAAGPYAELVSGQMNH
jgi:ABC-type multidrug transport system fused ATPase/permease subunit